jgi:hypothetical protein
VIVIDRSYTTNTAGEITLVDGVGIGSSVDIVASGHLNRQTLTRSADERQFSLWPQTSTSGLTEQLTEELVYTAAGSGPGGVGSPPGGATLARVDPSIARIAVIAPTLTLVSSGVAAIATASNKLTAATGGQITYVSDLEGSDGRIEIVVDPSSLPSGASASATATYNSLGYIVGGRVTVRDGACLTSICDITIPRSNGVTIVRTLVHEMGHLLGFNHTASSSVMNGGCSTPGCALNLDTRIVDFSSTEKILVKLMLQRRIRNRFPDNDRGSS